ncbi:dual specificity protein kinase splB isoform X2 [Sabethes cyaneus]|uniref:dual specificity protein kinase splB isoform X2 n=1 Tax=Sabethes cyaneus TaxID=53552 RepID=UPI00221E3191|nr:dual specificity protein kinase splB isoform X2 [Sabethes cyaneus]
MATNSPKKPPEHDTTTETFVFNHTVNNIDNSSSTSSSSGNFLNKRRSTCSCSNIAIMQLFHEMKQKFPTVPDHVVSDVVTANCHNRPACIDSLEKAVLGTPSTVQAYPSQSIHSTTLKRRINERKLSKLESSLSSGSNSSRENSVDKLSRSVGDAIGSSNGDFVDNNNRLNSGATTVNSIGDVPRDSGSANNADNNPTTTTTTTAAAFDNNNNRVALSRPNTLAFSGPRPTRVAPLPPISSTITASPELGETVNVQLNVTVSPVANRSPIGHRHTSTLQLQPEPPYSRELAQASSSFNTPGALPAGANSRSSTSVNLTLRQPSDRPQSPIHIHASPLKYTAKGFNAQSGIQSKLEITFRDGFGSISAMRTHVPGYEAGSTTTAGITCTDANGNVNSSNSHSNSNYLTHGQQQQNPYRDPHYQQMMAQYFPPNIGESNMQSFANNENDGLNRQHLYQNYLTEVAITQQLDQKNRLSEEVDRYRQQLDSIRREIWVLQQPLSPHDALCLSREIEILAFEVDQMQKEIDSAELTGSVSLPVASVEDGLSALSIEGSPTAPVAPNVNRPPRPPRPPPPKIPQPHPAPSVSAAGAGSTLYTLEGRYPGRSISAPAAGGRSVDPTGGSVINVGEPWTCSLCTFQNHELMTRCEVCSLAKVPGRLLPQVSVPAPSSASSHQSAALAIASPLPQSAPIANSVLLQSPSTTSSSSSVASSTASTPQAQPAPPPIQNAQYQKSSIEC